MSTRHTRIAWVDARLQDHATWLQELGAYFLPFGFELLEGELLDQADVLVLVAHQARDAYCHPLFTMAHQMGVPIVTVLNQATPMDRVAVLDQGADDCMVQPIERRELVARLKALRRRRQELEPAPLHWIRFGPWMLDTARRVLSNAQDLTVPLSQAEYRLLLTFLGSPYQVISRDRLMDEARGRGLEAFERSIDLLVSRLRNKLGDDPKQPRLIQTVRGRGYLFTATPNAATTLATPLAAPLTAQRMTQLTTPTAHAMPAQQPAPESPALARTLPCLVERASKSQPSL